MRCAATPTSSRLPTDPAQTGPRRAGSRTTCDNARITTRQMSRYLTWRLPDRHFSKVHVLGEAGTPLCGRVPSRERGRPLPPIPESELCPDCQNALGETQ